MATDVHPVADVAQVRVARRSVRHDMRAVKIVLHRELLRFVYDRTRMISQLIQPVLWLLIMGTGLSSLVASGGGVNLKTFMFPGVISMSVLFTAMFSAASIVWDREFGFLREMMVAPISRGSIVIGTCLGGATTASLQGLLILLMAGLVGVPYSFSLFFTVLAELILFAFTLTAFGVMTAARIQQFQAYMALNQMLLMPLFSLSGALFPLRGLPGWLHVLTRIDPLTYAVDPV